MSQTNKIILFVVETTPKANTDVLYISKAVNYLYKISADTKIQFEYLGTKSKYNDKGNIKRIEKDIKDFSEVHVIYCLNTDDINVKFEQIELNRKIESFCLEKGYDIIWFCRDIEEVFLHKQVDSSNKISEAKRFGSQNNLGKASRQMLLSKEKVVQKSNLMKVLNKYLDEKF